MSKYQYFIKIITHVARILCYAHYIYLPNDNNMINNGYNYITTCYHGKNGVKRIDNNINNTRYVSYTYMKIHRKNIINKYTMSYGI